jgi:hypothetical protein
MRNIRLVTLFIFALFVFCLPSMAQEYKFDDGRGNHGTLNIGGGQKTYVVTGTIYANERLSCQITGSYYPTTGRLKALCKDSERAQKWDVTGLKLKNKDAFQFSIGTFTYIAYRSVEGISGSWRIEQFGGGRTYLGTLILKQEGIKITGTAQWDNHTNGRVSGQLYENNSVSFTIYYSDGLEGYYKATLGKNGVDMVGGTARANKGGATVSWSAKRVSR